MPSATTVTQAIDDIRSHIDEPTAQFWSDAELTRWINEAQRDISRRTETLQVFSASLAAAVGTAKYILPADIIRIHRVAFVPTGSTQVYPMESKSLEELDQYWGINPNIQSSYPSFFSLWGTPGTLGMQMQVYPVPAQGGNFQLFYYRLPLILVNPTDTLDIPNGWEDLVTLYCEYVAKRKQRDSTWQEAKQLYDEKITNLIAVSRDYTDLPNGMIYGGSTVPAWLYTFEGM